ncbi:MAG: hypothetical protein KDK91_07935 [Gammaproteobacteria bacterium]|nr:hypothetical protein [Gammaproteobacteria bacterium]
MHSGPSSDIPCPRVFSDLDDFETFLGVADSIEKGEEPAMPPHFALNFERGADLPPALRKEIAEHQWEVAGSDAFPWPVAIDKDLIGRPPSARELTLAEAICRALPRLMNENDSLPDVWDGGESISSTLSVMTHEGEIEVTLSAPYAPAPIEFDPAHDILADLVILASDGGELDYHRLEALEDELLRRFAATPEAQGTKAADTGRLVMSLIFNQLGESIATLDADGLEEVLFDLFPRKVSIEASAARGLIEDTRAFYRFLKREFGLAQADACLQLLDDDAVDALEATLADSSNFDPAKSMIMAGMDAGFDMRTQEGIETWMRRMQDVPLPPSIALPDPHSLQPASKAAAKKRKDKRKAARTSRKKNR